jgi:hypothetical protein
MSANDENITIAEKMGDDGMQPWARELAPWNIAVNAVAPVSLKPA